MLGGFNEESEGFNRENGEKENHHDTEYETALVDGEGDPDNASTDDGVDEVEGSAGYGGFGGFVNVFDATGGSSW